MHAEIQPVSTVCSNPGGIDVFDDQADDSSAKPSCLIAIIAQSVERPSSVCSVS